ncbi:hydroxymethylbilane synthase [Sphingomonas lacunae]|uniref:Porphobilinogen deaminase n=1 Tax=Sphingomonas lacunae TaxID=2698828 RepID=A0A6M4AUI2_9SPHN|nr:hydroxymethylbilane synthase [Sphingomonas lacunae]QJQ31709.1 hydroxymethylbilane synthase [Sphingomonas lacunae]
MNQPFSDRPLRLGTRASPLAMRQAEMARDALLAAHGWSADAIELVPMVASGDKIQDRALAEVGGKALWTRELDRALADGDIDLSVHSMKDVETIRPTRFGIAAMLPRADVRDRLVGASSIDALPHGATIGTSSPRRSAQLLRLRPDLKLTLLRGNVGTRLGKIAAGDADATLLAAAGLDRLGMHDTGHAIPLDIMLPAPSQGAVGLEVRADDAHVRALVCAVDDQATRRCVEAERALLAALGGDCRSPIAALATIEADGAMRLRGEIYAMDGSDVVRTDALISDALTPAVLAHDMLDRAAPAVRRLFAG